MRFLSRGPATSWSVGPAPFWLTLILLVLNMPPASAGDAPRLVQLTDGSSTWVGQLLGRNQQTCILMDQHGAMHHLPVAELKSLKVVGDQFQPVPAAGFRKLLQAEFGADYETAAEGPYVVCAPRGRARAFAGLFRKVYQEIDGFFRIRGFETATPATPLVAVVLKSTDEFRAYCERDGMTWTETLRGYYSLKTNRVALFDDPAIAATAAVRSAPASEFPGRLNVREQLWGLADSAAVSPALLALRSTVSGETASTVIHETTHQVSCNIGIHSRIGDTPLWLMEGLATVLEAPGIRRRGNSSTDSKVNQGRLDWYAIEDVKQRQSGDIARLIASDELFTTRTLDAYSQAWALSFFLSENPVRSRQFMAYLKTVSLRDPMSEYTTEQRLQDATAAFGDLSRLETELNRRMEEL